MSSTSNTSLAQPSSAEFEKHGLFMRLLLGLIGMVFTLASVGMLVAIFPALRVTPRLEASLLGVVFLIILLFLCIATVGVNLVLRAIRGRSRRVVRFIRADAWYRRNWYLLSLVNFGLLAGVGMAVAGGPAPFVLGRGDTVLRFAWFGLLVLLVLPVHVAVHELGHAAMGALMRFRFTALRVGKLVLSRERNRMRISVSAHVFTELLGHQLSVPQGEESLGARFIAYAAGGPMASFALALLCRVSMGAVSPGSALGTAVALQLLSVGWWVGICLTVANALPVRFSSGVETDGALILGTLLARSPAAKAVWRIRLLWLQGRRPRDWAFSCDSLLNISQGEPANRESLLLAALAVALDTGNTARAHEILNRVVEIGPVQNRLIHYELELRAAMVEAFDGDAALARERLVRLGPHPTIPAYPLLAEAAVMSAEGRINEARNALDAWRAALMKMRIGSGFKVGNEWAEELLRARLRLDTAGSPAE